MSVHSLEYRARIASSGWERMRIERIAASYGKCEGCRRYLPNELQLHHLHYRTLGNEQPEDLDLLCRKCHERADASRRVDVFRQQMRRHQARVMAWAASDGVQRVRGAYWWER